MALFPIIKSDNPSRVEGAVFVSIEVCIQRESMGVFQARHKTTSKLASAGGMYTCSGKGLIDPARKTHRMYTMRLPCFLDGTRQICMYSGVQ